MDAKFIEKLIVATCDKFGVHPSSLYEKCRKYEIKVCRWIVWELIIVSQKATLERTACIFGKYNHSTIIHALDNIKGLLEYDKTAKINYNRIVSELGITISSVNSFRKQRESRKERKVRIDSANSSVDKGNPIYVSDQHLKKKMLRYKKMQQNLTA
jgi:hypothetical protein